MASSVYLVHGNIPEQVNAKRYELQRAALQGDEDGDVIDIRGAGTQPLKLEKALPRIIEEVATVSLIPDAPKVIVVYDLYEFRQASRGSARKTKKENAGKRDLVAELGEFLSNGLSDSNTTMIFAFQEDDEKRRLSKTSTVYQMLSQRAQTFEFSEKRLDWQLDDALLKGDLDNSIRLTREWLDRGGSAPFRLITQLNTFLQLLLQARLALEADRAGKKTHAFFPADLKPGLGSVPAFKAKMARGLAGRIPTTALHKSLKQLNDIQEAFFPTGNELVVPDAKEMVELMLIELFSKARV